MKRLVGIVLLFISMNMFGNNNDSIAIAEVQKQVDKQERIIGSLRKELRSAKSVQKELSTNIDSLRKELVSTQSELSSLSEKLGIDITNTQNQITNNAKSLGDSIKSKTIWGVSVAVLIIGMLVAVYLILYKRMQKGKTAIDKIKDAQKTIQEESLKLDDKLVNLLNQQLNVQANLTHSVSNNQIDHSLALKVADEIVKIETNLSRMDSSIKGYKPLVKAIERIKNNFSAKGYEMVDMLNKPYQEGMKASVTYVIDENLKDGEQVITKIIKPQVNYNGIMIQPAQIEVSQNE